MWLRTDAGLEVPVAGRTGVDGGLLTLSRGAASVGDIAGRSVDTGDLSPAPTIDGLGEGRCS